MPRKKTLSPDYLRSSIRAPFQKHLRREMIHGMIRSQFLPPPACLLPSGFFIHSLNPTLIDLSRSTRNYTTLATEALQPNSSKLVISESWFTCFSFLRRGNIPTGRRKAKIERLQPGDINLAVSRLRFMDIYISTCWISCATHSGFFSFIEIIRSFE